MGSCGDNFELVHQRLLALRNLLGLAEDILRVHPGDVPDQYRNAATLVYGLKILGSYVGTDEFIQDNLPRHAEELVRVADRLNSYSDLQGRSLVFRKCFLSKVDYIL